MDTCRIMNNKAKCGGYLIVGIDGLNVKDFEEEASMLLERMVLTLHHVACI